MVNYHDIKWHAGSQDRIESLSRELAEAKASIKTLEGRVRSLEAGTPEARQAQYELDVTLADNAASGFGEDYHGRDCQCPYCYVGAEEG
jgi:hypothetical protein